MDKYFYAIGRRKRSVASVRLFEGKGESMLNEKPLEKFVNTLADKKSLLRPFSILGKMDKYYFTVKVVGGGSKGQIQAAVHGISRALVKAEEEHRSPLKKAGLLTRDDRKNERKKTGLLKARKSPQFSKR